MKNKLYSNYFKAFTLSTLTIAFPATAYAGAWTLPKGDGQVIATWSLSEADESYSNDSKDLIAAKFSKKELQLYTEYGITDTITLIGKSALHRVNYSPQGERETRTGLGLTRLGIRRNLAHIFGWTVSLQQSLQLSASGEAIPDADLGQSGHGTELRLLAGRNLKGFGVTGFVDVQASETFRFNGNPSSRAYDLTLGFDIPYESQLFAQIFHLQTDANLNSTDLILPNESTKAQLSFVRPINSKNRLQFGAFHTIDGRNTVKETGATLSLWRAY